MRLKPTQRADVEFIKANNHRVLVANAPGTGKTPTTIRSIVESHKTTMPCLIICPSSVTLNWIKEIKIWAPGIPVIHLEGYSKKITFVEGPVFYVCSWAILDAREELLKRLNLKTIVADEAHFAKNPDAIRSQALRSLCTKDKGILLLTGTPIVNSKDELQILQELYGKTPPMIRRMLEEVAPDIPPKKRSYLYIKMKEKDQKNYDKAVTDFEEWLRDKTDELTGEGKSEAEIARILSAEGLIKIGYLRRMVGVAKVYAASDFIARAIRVGEPVVVFLEHQPAVHTLSRLLHRQRIRHAIIEGSTTTKKRQEFIDQFQNNEYPVIMCSKAGKEGITLHAARHLLFVERFFTSADEEQAEDRIRRIGQTHATTIWYMHVENTVDDRIDQIVRNKRNIIDENIGLEDIEESDESTVEKIIRDWSKFVRESDQQPITPLGLGQSLPPLPGPKDTHGVVFKGVRWKAETAKAWCKMHGYEVSKIEVLQDRFKCVTRPSDLFKKGSFATQVISGDIKIITGEKLPDHVQKIVRQKLRAV